MRWGKKKEWNLLFIILFGLFILRTFFLSFGVSLKDDHSDRLKNQGFFQTKDNSDNSFWNNINSTFSMTDLDKVGSWDHGRHLVVSYYKGGYSEKRIAEITKVLLLNLENEYIAKVHILCENSDLPVDILGSKYSDKIVRVDVKRQPTYADFFRYANRIFLRGAIVIISNTDIELGEDMKCLREMDPVRNAKLFDSSSRRLVLGLSRHPAKCGVSRGEYNECGKYRGSHDTFVFAPPLSEDFISRVDFVQNRLGAENRLLYELRSESYRISNPCHVIKVYHHHCTKNSRVKQTGRFAKKGDGKYASVDPLAKFKCNDLIY